MVLISANMTLGVVGVLRSLCQRCAKTYLVLREGEMVRCSCCLTSTVRTVVSLASVWKR